MTKPLNTFTNITAQAKAARAMLKMLKRARDYINDDLHEMPADEDPGAFALMDAIVAAIRQAEEAGITTGEDNG